MGVTKVGAFKIIDNLLYSRTHCWVKPENKLVRIGVDDYLQRLMGRINYIETPFVRDELKKADAFATMESENRRIKLYPPLSGIVEKVNEEIISNPSLVNTDCYGVGWIILLQPIDFSYESRCLIKGIEAREWLIEELRKRKQYLPKI